MGAFIAYGGLSGIAFGLAGYFLVRSLAALFRTAWWLAAKRLAVSLASAVLATGLFGIGVIIAALRATEDNAVPPAEKATILAEGISEAMNSGGIVTLLAVAIGVGLAARQAVAKPSAGPGGGAPRHWTLRLEPAGMLLAVMVVAAALLLLGAPSVWPAAAAAGVSGGVAGWWQRQAIELNREALVQATTALQTRAALLRSRPGSAARWVLLGQLLLGLGAWLLLAPFEPLAPFAVLGTFMVVRDTMTLSSIARLDRP